MIDLNTYSKQGILIPNKEHLLRYVTPYEVYCRYIGYSVPVKTIIISPFLRNGVTEKYPSFGLFQKQGELLFNDYALGGGDFIHFVSKLFNLSYLAAIHKIIIDFNLTPYFFLTLYTNNIPTNKLNFNFELADYKKLLTEKEKPLIQITPRKWKFHDVKYWASYGLDIPLLHKYSVIPISGYSVDSVQVTTGNFAYAYEECKDNTYTYKIYQPFNCIAKWVTNNDNSVLQGWNHLPHTGDILIITKSLKDTLVVIKNIPNVYSISLQNEASGIKEQILKDLEWRFAIIYLLLDNDYDKSVNYGQNFAKALMSRHHKVSIYNLLIPTKYKSKDISDLYKNHGPQVVKDVFAELLDINNKKPF